ncbi:rhodanese-like domain-containing protein [Mucilaginibacter sp.]|jgi:hypothetical protein|uniref:rhodanese-like domain-containing protein n=1 Tax=Mucilaginibacter sp. TaxID=1882438 RepID=UPI003568CB90
MKKIGFLIAAIAIAFSLTTAAQSNPEPWKPEQLLAPKQLADLIKSNAKDKLLIISVGPAALIKGSVDIGAVHDQVNLSKLKTLLLKEKKDREIVIYCGCCPFEHCPNIRPAFKLLNELRFTNQKLLNLPRNLKADWIDQGYPTNN